MPLDRSFYLRPADVVAKELLGCRLIVTSAGKQAALMITETEAYLGIDDPACHSYGDRRTERTRVMYGPGGHAYIYLVYGMHLMLNAVTGGAGDPCAVLIRGGIPLDGHDLLSANRCGKPWAALTAAQRRSLSDGPGKLAAALGLIRSQNGADLCDPASGLYICAGDGAAGSIQAGPRIGIDYAGEAASWPLNFRLTRK